MMRMFDWSSHGGKSLTAEKNDDKFVQNVF